MNVSHERIALVGDWRVGMITGNDTPVFHIAISPVFVLQVLTSTIFNQLCDTSPVPVADSKMIVFGDFLYTFLYSEKEVVRKNGSGILDQRDRNQRSPEDFSLRSLDIVLLTLRSSFSISRSMTFSIRILPESIEDDMYQVIVFILDEASHPVLE